MSVKAVSAAFEEGDRLNLPPVDRLILLRLGDWADDYGYCFPGVGDLCAKVGVDERTIRRHMTELESQKLVARLVQGGGKGRSTLYRMLPEVLPDVPHPPGVARYEARYGLEVNPDILSPFPQTRTNGNLKGDDPAVKRGHSPVRLSVNDPSLNPAEDFENSDQEPDPYQLSDSLAVIAHAPQEDGETKAQYLRRLQK